MDWFAALVTRANAAAGITAAIGAASKVFPEEAPQTATRPFVTMLDVTELRPQHLKGYDLESSRVQIDVWTDSYTSKNAIMEAVIAALVPPATSNGHYFSRAMIALGPRDVSGERDGTAPVRRKSADLIFHHKPA